MTEEERAAAPQDAVTPKTGAEDKPERFVTEGTVDADFFRSLKAYLVPPAQQTLVLAAALMLSGGLIALGIFGGRRENIALGCVFAVVLLGQYFTASGSAVNTSIKRLHALSRDGTMDYRTAVREDGVHVLNRTAGGEGTIPWDRLAQTVETERCLVLFSQSRQYLPVFKDGLAAGDRDALLTLLREKCPDMKFSLR